MISLTKQFVKEMERRILTGELEIGSKLPSLRTLADEFHVSRSVVNAGIVELCNNGYLTTLPRRYVCVSDWRKTGNFAMLKGMMENELCDVHFFEDLLEGRMTIEKAIAKKAAIARTEQDIEEIKNIIAKEKMCQTSEEQAEADKEFHHAQAVASHNAVYTVILNSFHTLEDKWIQEFYEKEIDRKFVIGMHEKLYEAIKSGNTDKAEKYMETLLTHGENELRK